jgi:hypothetical protein
LFNITNKKIIMSLFDSASLVVTPNGTKASKLYAIKPTDGGDLSVTRATTATRVNSSGLIESVATNVPRLDYTNGTCPSILVEPQRTNLFSYSEQFDNASWTKLDSSISSNATISPDGTTTADKLIENSSTANHLIQKAVVAINSSYSFSVYAKKAERNWIVLRGVNAAFQNVKAWFNIDAGTVGTLENGATGTITSVGNGWYKCTMIIPTFSTGFEFRVSLSTGNGVDSYLGNGTSGAYIWGAQLEAGSYATSYIPTVASSVTRNADVISKTGISTLIGQTEGTMFLDVNVTKDGSGYYPLGTLIGATSSIYIGINTFITTGNIYAEIRNTTQQALISSSINSGRCKIALAYKANDIALYINGNLIGTDTSATIPATSAFSFEYDVSIGNRNTKNINDVVLWKTRLTNAELATLTTI